MRFESDIDNLCAELILKIEKMRDFLKIKPQDGGFCESGEGETTSDRERGESLEDAIREAILRLGETKKYFKSKTVKEVREKLIRVLKE